MGRRGWTAEEADDWVSEHGTGVMPWDVSHDESAEDPGDPTDPEPSEEQV